MSLLEKKFICGFCNLGFTRPNHLLRHEENKHMTFRAIVDFDKITVSLSHTTPCAFHGIQIIK